MSVPAVGSVAALFRWRVGETPDSLAYRFPHGAELASLTWRQTDERVRRMAAGLLALGLRPEERSAILCSTRLEWILIDLAIGCAGGATTTIYPSSTGEDCAFILENSDTRFVFAENDDQVAKLTAQKVELGKVERVIVIDAGSGGARPEWVISLTDLEERGRELLAREPDAVDRVIDAIQPHNLATIIYTSGTTGKPKGVELPHDAWLFEAQAIDEVKMWRPGDESLLWLPLAHSFGKVLQVGQIRIGSLTTVDGRVDRIVENCAKVRPQVMAAAPRIFEKVYGKLVTDIRGKGGFLAAFFDWAVPVGIEFSRCLQAKKAPDPYLRIRYWIADRLLFRKVRGIFGGSIRFFISGSAPLARELAEFFHAAGLPIMEGYGLTETSAATFVNRLDDFRFGTVGKPLPGASVKLAEDGEILLGGRGVMRGYWKLPEDSKAVLQDGFLATGDIGEIDADGFLRITDRKKDLIKTSGGKYIAPQRLEAGLKLHCPYIAHVIVHGDRRNFCSALITLDEESMKKWARAHDAEGRAYTELTQDPRVVAMVAAAVEKLNATLAKFETLKKFRILPKDLSLEAGDLTPSMKVRRKVVEQKHRDILDEFYKDPALTV